MALKNVTITVEEDVARWARVEAAKKNTSVSRMVGEMLREKMTRSESYQKAMETWLSLPPVKIRRKGQKLPTREELYDRPGPRRH